MDRAFHSENFLTRGTMSEQAMEPAFIQSLQPGQRIVHSEFGEGVVIEAARDGLVRVFFSTGERGIAAADARPHLPRNDRILRGVEGSAERLRRVRLAYEAHALPLVENAAALTAAKVDLLPHQIVLTARVASSSPRRFLIADEVGLGKTIETALILRELASRGELRRALMVVPAGLVNNWHRELNEVFGLNFEVFGSEGDVTDRKSNAFARHDRLIASIDTLKRPARVRRLLEAPIWDLVVFDEAHHLTAYRNGARVTRTGNYKLAESLKGHSRDLLLLSATPHQGDHFRFWMLIQLLNPTIFSSPEDMGENRHRLNAVVFRRTKADACKPDGSPLFARRWVHTESFTMSPQENHFYDELRGYLEDGFALAKRKGNQGRALGFVMTIFQKIAASSFAAVRRTLRRRLLMLTIHEAILRERDLDIDRRQALYAEAREMIRQEFDLGQGAMANGRIDSVLAELKLVLLKRLDEEALESASDAYAGESEAQFAEDAAANAVNLDLPEERLRIRDLLERFPAHRESKVEKLLNALGTLWRQNSQEKVVIFATYLGTVEMLGRAIEEHYPGQGVVVLKGGDHGAKLAAERSFRRKDGPRVLVCTAAGREGINLQFARVLFNFDLPWNPMDIEQRIGRIHRYGQNHTAQVYNLVLSDTIEGKIFLLLNDKLLEIARTVGKVDEHGNVAEDLRIQILGQLSERLSYDRLYQEALSDPELRRTRLEIEAALANATEARKVVYDLFQDLEAFRLDDYKPFADTSANMDRIVRFLSAAIADQNRSIRKAEDGAYEIISPDGEQMLRFTTDRETARRRDEIDLLGIDHVVVQNALRRWASVPPEELGVSLAGEERAVLTWWQIDSHGTKGLKRSILTPIAVNMDGARLQHLERSAETIFHKAPAPPVLDEAQREALLRNHIEPMLNRELNYLGIAGAGGGFSAQMIAWVEIIVSDNSRD